SSADNRRQRRRFTELHRCWLVAVEVRARRSLDRFVETTGHALELHILFDLERAIENLAVNRRRPVQSHVVTADGPLERAMDGDVLRGDVALDVSTIADHELAYVDIADDATVNLHRTVTDDVAGDDHPAAKLRRHVRNRFDDARNRVDRPSFLAVADRLLRVVAFLVKVAHLNSPNRRTDPPHLPRLRSRHSCAC